MTSTVFVLVTLLVVLAVAIFLYRRMSRYAQSGRPVDLGVVSTRWISELRRDEPWTRS